jgi:hypothetical protein
VHIVKAEEQERGHSADLSAAAMFAVA